MMLCLIFFAYTSHHYGTILAWHTQGIGAIRKATLLAPKASC